MVCAVALDVMKIGKTKYKRGQSPLYPVLTVKGSTHLIPSKHQLLPYDQKNRCVNPNLRKQLKIKALFNYKISIKNTEAFIPTLINQRYCPWLSCALQLAWKLIFAYAKRKGPPPSVWNLF
jgi:hypothetical protein